MGGIVALLMVTMASCIFFPWCPAYRRKEKNKQKSKRITYQYFIQYNTYQYCIQYNLCSGSWNHLPHTASTQSGVNNIYSQACWSNSSLLSLQSEDTFTSQQTQLIRMNTLTHDLSWHSSKLWSNIVCIVKVKITYQTNQTN